MDIKDRTVWAGVLHDTKPKNYFLYLATINRLSLWLRFFKTEPPERDDHHGRRHSHRRRKSKIIIIIDHSLSHHHVSGTSVPGHQFNWN